MSQQQSGKHEFYPSRGGGADTRVQTLVIAASNSVDPTLAPPAYRCDGVADDVEINAAIGVLP